MAEKPLDTIDPLVADAMGEVVASMMKRDTLDHYRRERDENISVFDEGCTGHYAGCLAEAEEMIERLRKRGFDVVKRLSPGPGDSEYTKDQIAILARLVSADCALKLTGSDRKDDRDRQKLRRDGLISFSSGRWGATRKGKELIQSMQTGAPHA